MSTVTGFRLVDANGQVIPSDPHGNNIAFKCLSCGGPVLAETREHQRGSSQTKPTHCPSCQSSYWIEVFSELKCVQLHRLSPVARQAEVFANQIQSWQEFTDLIEHFSYFCGHSWLFRGAPDATYKLIPKIGRNTTRGLKGPKGSKWRVPYRIADEQAVLSMFKQQALPHLRSVPRNEIEWLAIAQHFGLPTRLLDWTDSLLVAAWFAVEHGGAKKVDAAIWVTRNIPAIGNELEQSPLTIPAVYSYRPPHIDGRISAQSSVFVLCPEPEQELTLDFCKKIVIQANVQFTLKKRLNACGIGKRQLFPDLQGLSEHLAWVYKNDWLAGHRPDGDSEASVTSDDAEETD